MKRNLKFMSLIMWMVLSGVSGFALEESESLQEHVSDEGFIIQPIVNEIEREVSISIQLKEFELKSVVIDGEMYSTVQIAEAGKTYNSGEPLLPSIGQLYHISDTLKPIVSVEIIQSHDIMLRHPILPAQTDLEEEDVQTISEYNYMIYSDQDWYPNRDVFIEEPAVLRDVRVLPVAFYPMRYHPATNTLRVIDEAVLTIRMVEGDSPNILTQHGPYSPSFEPFYKALIPNYDDSWTNTLDRSIAEHYLLVMPDAFESRCQGFIAWKEQQGFKVDILRLSSLGTSPTFTLVKNAIQALYSGANRPAYLSILGSTNNFPIHTSHDNYMSGDFDDDLYYSQLDGSDLLPDIFYSRFPVTTADELTIMLSRILQYEQTPDTNSPTYYKTALTAASGLYASQITTKEQTAERMSTNLGYTTIHNMYDWSSSSVSQIQGWLNQGVSLINYRGEGWQAGWHPGHAYDFEYTEVYPIQNGHRFPVITSIGCGVAMFDGYSECFGHAWVTLGTASELRGAVAFMGPTWNTRTTINNWIDRGIYRGFCYHNITRSGQAFNYGKIYAYTHFLGTQYMTNDIPTHMREYILFGNPDLWWRTDNPRSASVQHAWCPGSAEHGIVVIDTNGKKIANAQICFLKDGEQRVYVTDGGGGSKIQMDDVTEPIPYTLTGWNLIPVFGTFVLPETGEDGDLVITEIKPDVTTSGLAGDKIEIANLEMDTSVNLLGWTIGDLDGYDVPFVQVDAILGPQQLAVIEFVGPSGASVVTPTVYGLSIKSRATIGLSSLEDTCVLRNTTGRVRDAVCYHNGSGIGSTDESLDMSKLTLSTSPLSMGSRAWWTGPDEVTQATYETYAINWSSFAGEGGVGSIQRISIPGSGIYDSPSNFIVSATTNFGAWTFPTIDLLTNMEGYAEVMHPVVNN